jgi:DNA repair protein RadA
MLHKLSRFAEVHNVAVVITNQVQSQPDDFGSGDGLRATGGNVMGHASTYTILLRKAGPTRIAIMIDSPYRHSHFKLISRACRSRLAGNGALLR